jgi:hypothetical protein
VIPFKETFEFNDTIKFCYSRQTIALQSRIPIPKTWAMVEKMLKIQIPIVNQCVLNQFHGHWLLPNAIFVAISMIFGMCNINFVATDVM